MLHLLALVALAIPAPSAPTLVVAPTSAPAATHPVLACPTTTLQGPRARASAPAATLLASSLLARLAPARPAADPPPLLPPAPADPRAASARAAYAAGEYVAAARQYAALARDAAPRYLFNAGMAREAAGELAHAALLWRRYLASGTASPEDRELLARKLAAAAASLIPRQFAADPQISALTLTHGDNDPLELGPADLADPLILEAGEWTARILSPGEPLELRFTVADPAAPPVVLSAPPVHVDPPPDPPTPTGDLTLHLGPPRALRRGVEISLKNDLGVRHETQKTAEATWNLPRGTWTVSAAAADRTTITKTVTVGDLPERLDLSLRLSPAARRQRIVAPAILGAAGLGLAVGGAVLVARGRRDDLTCVDETTCTAAANSVLDVSAGLALVGTGVGALIPAATAAAGARTRVLAVEAGLGATIFTGGLTWYLAETRSDYQLDARGRDHAAATILGAGAGMLGSAAVVLIVRRILARRAAPIAVAPTSRGVTINF